MSGRAENAVRSMTRMDKVQSPIIPVIGAMIRQTPGTISLGQGVVHYGPPQAAVDAIRDGAGRRRETPTVTATPRDTRPSSRRSRASSKPRTASTWRRAAGSWSRLAQTWRSCMRCCPSPIPATRSILPTPFYFNHEMAIDMAGCCAVRVPTDDHYQLRLDAIAAAITARTRAIVTISPNNPSGAVLTEASLRAVNALCRERGLFHISRRALRVLHLRRAPHVSPGALPALPHTRSRCSPSRRPTASPAGGSATWCIPSASMSAMVKSQDTILICPTIARRWARRRRCEVGRGYCEGYVAELASVRDIVVGELSALAPLASVPAADGAFYCC